MGCGTIPKSEQPAPPQSTGDISSSAAQLTAVVPDEAAAEPVQSGQTEKLKSDVPSSATLPGQVGEENRTVEPGSPRRKPIPTPQDILLEAMEEHFLFWAFDPQEIKSLLDLTVALPTKKGDVIVSKGEQGDSCFFVLEGSFSMSRDQDQLQVCRPGTSFGDLSLLHNIAQAATVTSCDDGVLWRLSAAHFHQAVLDVNAKHQGRITEFLEEDTFRGLFQADKDALASASVQAFTAGETMLWKGEDVEWVSIIMKGHVPIIDEFGCTVLKSSGSVLGAAELFYLQKHCFGAKAIDDVICLVAGKRVLKRLSPAVLQFLRKHAIMSLLVEHRDPGGEDSDLEFVR